jgi:hypothetical protein
MAMILRRLILFKFDEIKQIAAQWEEQEQLAPECPTPKYRGVVKPRFNARMTPKHATSRCSRVR